MNGKIHEILTTELHLFFLTIDLYFQNKENPTPSLLDCSYAKKHYHLFN